MLYRILKGGLKCFLLPPRPPGYVPGVEFSLSLFFCLKLWWFWKNSGSCLRNFQECLRKLHSESLYSRYSQTKSQAKCPKKLKNSKKILQNIQILFKNTSQVLYSTHYLRTQEVNDVNFIPSFLHQIESLTSSSTSYITSTQHHFS